MIRNKIVRFEMLYEVGVKQSFKTFRACFQEGYMQKLRMGEKDNKGQVQIH